MKWAEGLNTVCRTVCDFAATGTETAVFLKPSVVRKAARRLLAEGYFIEDVTCMDVEEGFLVLYHYDSYDTPGRVTLRVVLDHDEAKVPSIADIYHGAEWHERECMDFYPVEFTDNPNPARLLLPDDFTDKPLLKAEDKRVPMLDIFHFNDLVDCAPDHPVAQAVKERHEAMLEAKAKAKAEAEAAEKAKEAEDGESGQEAPAEG